MEYLNLIQNCISKCDDWGSRVDYKNCLKSCKKENSFLKHLETSSTERSEECVDIPCEAEVKEDDKLLSDCLYGSSSSCGRHHGIEEVPAGKRREHEGNCSGSWCSLDQLRKRRWGDPLITCIASYCNSLQGKTRVDCIINMCDKQRRGWHAEKL